ncbi:unnamed protein product, partial [Mycena citricolor]
MEDLGAFSVVVSSPRLSDLFSVARHCISSLIQFRARPCRASVGDIWGCDASNRRSVDEKAGKLPFNAEANFDGHHPDSKPHSLGSLRFFSLCHIKVGSTMAALPMSHLICPDAPLLSPTEYHFDMDALNFPYYTLSPSPPTSDGSDSPPPLAPHSMLKLPMVDNLNCVPTHQLFDYAQGSPSPSEASGSPHQPPRLSISINSSACKRSSASPPPQSRKRTVGERIHSKDFKPPDVTGLSKREARLVKNRAAAFLSRQRKREEFELMEVRVAELEQENARLLALASGSDGARQREESGEGLVSEVEQLRAQLLAAEKRERELNAELSAQSASHEAPTAVKTEPPEAPLSLTLSPSPRLPSRTAASLGLM